MGLEPQKYTERLGVIDPEQLFAVVEAFDLGDVHDAHAPSGGLFGQNLIIKASKGEFVLRGNPFVMCSSRRNDVANARAIGSGA